MQGTGLFVCCCHLLLAALPQAPTVCGWEGVFLPRSRPTLPPCSPFDSKRGLIAVGLAAASGGGVVIGKLLEVRGAGHCRLAGR